MSIELERERLSQTKSLAHFRREMSLAEKVTVDQLWNKSKGTQLLYLLCVSPVEQS